MVLDGVPIEDRDVPALARILPPALGRKLTVAHTFGSQIVALTATESDELVAAVAGAPAALDDDLRNLILNSEYRRRRVEP